CIDTEYAAHKGQNERVLTAAWRRTVGDCGEKIYARDTFQYDEQALGEVTAGLVTAHGVERRDEAGTPLGDVGKLTARYTPQGNPVTMTLKRGDGAARSVSVTYDAFALVPTIAGTSGIGVPSLRVDLVRDPLTL